MSKVTLELFILAVNKLRDLKEKYRKTKNEFESKEFHILIETDFKEIYGQNNDKIRKGHIKKELGELYEEKQKLKDEIDYQENLVEYYRGVINE